MYPQRAKGALAIIYWLAQHKPGSLGQDYPVNQVYDDQHRKGNPEFGYVFRGWWGQRGRHPGLELFFFGKQIAIKRKNFGPGICWQFRQFPFQFEYAHSGSFHFLQHALRWIFHGVLKFYLLSMMS